jgi:hypothetical protein
MPAAAAIATRACVTSASRSRFTSFKLCAAREACQGMAYCIASKLMEMQKSARDAPGHR